MIAEVKTKKLENDFFNSPQIGLTISGFVTAMPRQAERHWEM